MEAISTSQALIRHSLRRRYLVFAFLGLVTLVLMSLNISIGSISHPLIQILNTLANPVTQIWDILVNPDKSIDQIWGVLANPGKGTSLGDIVWKIRLPRTLAAAMGGAFLAASGLLLQVYFRNPIVGPFILGISSGATVTVSLIMLTGAGMKMAFAIPFMTTIAGCLGAYAVMAVVVAISAKIKSGTTLLIVGLMMGYLCSAVTAILTAFAESEKIKGFILWQLGSFSGFKWVEIWIMFFFGGALLMGIYLLSKPLNAFLLGEDYAASMGVNIRRFRIFILLAASSLAGLVTSLAGPVAFIGLAIPHMARLSLGTADNRILLPGAALMGAAVTSLCDLIARMWLSPVELPLSAVTAFFGAPIVIVLLLKRGIKT